MKKAMSFPLTVATLSLAATAAWATEGHDRHHSGTTAAAPPAAAASTGLTGGEVRKVDAAQGKVTIRHEPIANLDMPAMTMVFRAATPELLKDLKAGDRIRFRAETQGGALVMTQVESVR